MRKLRQTLAAFGGAVALIFSVAPAGSAQLPYQTLHSGSVVEPSTFALPPCGSTRAH